MGVILAFFFQNGMKYVLKIEREDDQWSRSTED